MTKNCFRAFVRPENAWNCTVCLRLTQGPYRKDVKGQGVGPAGGVISKETKKRNLYSDNDVIGCKGVRWVKSPEFEGTSFVNGPWIVSGKNM